MSRWPGHRFALGLALSLLALWLAVMAIVMRLAALGPEAPGPLLAVFEPGTGPEEALARIVRAGGKPLRPTAFPFIWAIAQGEPGLAGRLMAEGAAGTYAELPLPMTIAGCFALADAKLAQTFGP